MIRAVVFDADGVVIKKRAMYFTQRLARDKGISYAPIASFVHKDLPRLMVGRADLKVVLKKYIPLWGWRGSVTSLMDYWFSHEAAVDPRVLQSIAQLRRRGIRCYVATDNDKYRTAYLWKTVGLNKHFDGIFSSAQIGAVKSQPAFWRAVHRGLRRIPKGAVLVWDDNGENIRAARSFGFPARRYSNFTTYEKIIRKLAHSA